LINKYCIVWASKIWIDLIVFIAQSQIGNVDRRCFPMFTIPHYLFNFSCFCWFHLWLRWIRSGKFIIYITLTLSLLRFWFLSIRIWKLIKCTDLKFIYALTEFCYFFLLPSIIWVWWKCFRRRVHRWWSPGNKPMPNWIIHMSL